MADRLINEDAVLALIDGRIARAHATMASPLATNADKRALQAVVNAMQALQDEVIDVPTEDYTEADKLAMFSEGVANDIGAPLQERRA